MNTSDTILRRLASTIGLTAAIAAIVVPAALAGTSSSTLGDARAPDTRDAAALTAQPTTRELRSPDTLDSAIATAFRNRQDAPTSVDARSPDTTDAAYQAHNPTVVRTPPGGAFAWRDFGIGFAAATGAFLLLLGGVIFLPAARGHRRGASPAATA